MIIKAIFLIAALSPSPAFVAADFTPGHIPLLSRVVRMLRPMLARSEGQEVSPSRELTQDDGRAFMALTEPVKRLGIHRPAIVFVYNYYDFSNQLREQGVRAYSMTIGLSGAHLHGILENFPFRSASLGGVVVLQKTSYSNLFEAIDAIAQHGFMAIRDADLPYLGQVVILGMGFRKTLMSWHDVQIYRRIELKMFSHGTGYEVFNMKKVASPYLVRRDILAAA